MVRPRWRPVVSRVGHGALLRGAGGPSLREGCPSAMGWRRRCGVLGGERQGNVVDLHKLSILCSIHTSVAVECTRQSWRCNLVEWGGGEGEGVGR